LVLPSPSDAARRYWNTQPWRDLARLCSGTPNPRFERTSRKGRCAPPAPIRSS
jgi:hypothetical protein